MFRFYWIITIAFGLVLAGSLQAQQQDAESSQSPAEQKTQAIELPNPFPVIIVESDEAADAREAKESVSRQNEKDDLIAQQGMNTATQAMNEATQSMKRASWVSAGLVGLGTVLLVWTLLQSGRATKAANLAVDATIETGRDQSRAYVHIKTVHRVELTDGRHRFMFFVQNSGQTPCKRFTIHASAKYEDFSDEEIKIDFNQADFKNSGWSGLPTDTYTAPINLEVVGTKPGSGLFHVFGFVEYITFFDEVFVSEFSFIEKFGANTKPKSADYGFKMQRSTSEIKMYGNKSN